MTAPTQVRAGMTPRGLVSFKTAEDAARAYDAAPRKHQGEFAYLNFPEKVA